MMSAISIIADLRPKLGPIRDQGVRSTCVAHAVSAAHEGSRGDPTPLSPEYLHHYAADGDPDFPVNFTEIADALEYYGQPVETDCPYRPQSSDILVPPQGVRVFRRLSERHEILPDVVHELVRSGRFPVLGMTVPRSFYEACGTEPVLDRPGPIRGRHAVVAVGLGALADRPHVLVRNSWGIDWGDHGHAWLGPDFLERHLCDILLLTHEAKS